MSKRNFEEWFKTFRASINGYGYYIDFNKVYKNVEKLKVEINILNSLIGSKNIEKEFCSLLKKYPECLKIIPNLLAIRENEIYCQDEKGAVNYNFIWKKTKSKDKENFEKEIKDHIDIKDYAYFMEKTGLFDMLKNHIINNLYDYLTGVEVGLDSNGRKNRGGHQMENLVERYLKNANLEYYKEMYLSEIEKKWNIDLSNISQKGTTTKRWDFVVKTKNNIYVIETNFYASSGSKLNETSRSYKKIFEESENIKGFAFVWITDGAGWKNARNNLKETFDIMDNLYNIKDMEDGIFMRLFK